MKRLGSQKRDSSRFFLIYHKNTDRFATKTPIGFTVKTKIMVKRQVAKRVSQPVFVLVRCVFWESYIFGTLER